jgi:hypothetical protein
MHSNKLSVAVSLLVSSYETWLLRIFHNSIRLVDVLALVYRRCKSILSPWCALCAKYL